MKTIRKGYKQTDIGIVPEDWEVVALGSVFTTFPTASYAREELGSGDVKYIHYGDIHTKFKTVVFADKEAIPTISESKARRYAKLKDGDIILADASEDYVGIGKGIEVLNCSNINIISGLHTIPLRDKSQNYVIGFHGYICLNKYIKQQFERQAVGTKVYSISYNSIRECLIPIPTKPEQRAIAEVLSDIDSLIEATDKKIIKKRAIKEGAMQQLLTGRKRLSGFSKPWIEKKFYDLFNHRPAKNYQINTDAYNECGNFPIIDQGQNLIAGYTNDKSKIYSCSASGIIIFGDHTRIFKFINLDFAIGADGTQLLEVDSECNAKFIFYKCLLLELPDTGYNRHFKFLKEESFHIPPMKEEQQAIAQILTDMDDEIEQLEKQRAKYTVLKQGAMQKLLTGEIRLVKAAAQPQKSAEIRTIPVSAHIVGGHIVNKLHDSKGWGRTKLQKSIHLLSYCCQIDVGARFIRNTAGPDDQELMNHIDSKFKQYRQVDIETTTDNNGRKHYNYIPTSMIDEVEQAFENYPAEIQKAANDLLAKIWKMDLARAEIVSTLYAVWNNRIIKKQPINNTLLFEDFYDWSEHKADFSQDLVLRALSYMNKEGIIPLGWGKYIDKK